MMDMMVLAFQTDATRVISYLLAHDGSNRTFKQIGVADGHHNISHHQRNPEKLEMIARIDLWYMQQFAYFLDRMKKTEDVDGKSLLHNSMILYGGGISDGNAHSHHNLPIVMAGNAGGNFHPGRHVRGDRVALANLHVRMLNEFGVKTERFGDSRGQVKDI